MLTDSDGMHLKMDNHRFGDFLPTVDDFRDPEIKKNFETADVFNDKGHDENVAGDTRVLENATLTRFFLSDRSASKLIEFLVTIQCLLDFTIFALTN